MTMLRRMLPALLLALALVPVARAEEQKPPENCTNGVDDDGDAIVDCGDADCYAAKECQPGGDENTSERCSDFVDNDSDGLTDCDDPDCEGRGIKVCEGSWRANDDEPAAPVSKPGQKQGASFDPESLIGTQGDLDGERSNESCADGIDNDADGRTDCQDFGCRYDPSVTICQPGGGSRFSVVLGVQASNLQKSVDGVVSSQSDTSIRRLQLRALGSIPSITNSFYLLSIRAERSVRLTFAMFQIPVGSRGHYINVNSGSGGLSSALVTSVANQLLIDPAAYVYKAFEQGNGASFEAGGPIIPRKLNFRAFVAAGSGKSTGNIGGSFYSTADRNFNWSVGGQLQFNIVGAFTRFDSPFLYTPVPLTAGAFLGAKFDQRDDERYPALNAFALFRWNRLALQAESYSKYELNFRSFQTAYVVQAGVLVIPKRLLLAADWGQYLAQPYAVANSVLQNPLEEWQFRAAAHVYVWKNIGIASAVFRERHQAPREGTTQETIEREVSAELQFRF
jgi:hypothetical protein